MDIKINHLNNKKEEIKQILRTSKEKPLIILDYDGTLNPTVFNIGEGAPPQKTLNILQNLLSHFNIIIATGRPVNEVDSFFPFKEIICYSEHGAHKRISGQWLLSEFKGVEGLFIDLEKMLKSNKKWENLHIEKKIASLVIHLKQENDKELFNLLKNKFQNEEIEVMQGYFVIDIRLRVNNKSRAVIENRHFEIILCAGDDTSDEDMFRECLMNENHFSVKIGKKETSAKFFIENSENFLEFLEFLME